MAPKSHFYVLKMVTNTNGYGRIRKFQSLYSIIYNSPVFYTIRNMKCQPSLTLFRCPIDIRLLFVQISMNPFRSYLYFMPFFLFSDFNKHNRLSVQFLPSFVMSTSDSQVLKLLRHAVRFNEDLGKVVSLVKDAILEGRNNPQHLSRMLRPSVDRAIRKKNNDALDAILKTCNETNPDILRCLLQGGNSTQPLLLVLAVQSGNVEAMEILLQHGANPNGDEVTHSNFLQSPLRVAALSPRSEQFDDEHSLSFEMIRLLLKHGADPLKHVKNGSGTVPLHFASHLAVVCPDAAALLVESTPPLAYDCLFNWPPGSPCSSGTTPLSMALFETQQILRQNRTGNAHQNTLRYVVLPLLKGGAHLHPDPLADLKALTNLHELYQSLLNLPFYQQHDCGDRIIELILACRPNLAFTDKCLKQLSNISADLVPFNERFFQSFPLRLDFTCRHVILKNLPKGQSNRQKAIEKLQLPVILRDFLSFSHFNSLLEENL